MKGLISAVTWVPRGVASRNPKKYQLDDNELRRVSALTQIELEDTRIEVVRNCAAISDVENDAEDCGAEDRGPDDEDEVNWVDESDLAMEVDSGVKRDDVLSQYNLEGYDDDIQTENPGLFSNIKGLTYYTDNEEDPYITLKEEEDEHEELEIYPTDNLIVTAKTEDDISQLEVFVYDESQENLYVHHDLMLPNFPLCLEWLDFLPASSDEKRGHMDRDSGNFIAVGTLDPEIEIWSLDLVESMYPHSILGRAGRPYVPAPLSTRKKKKKTKRHSTETAYHVDAVLGLSWNKIQKNLLASASADKTVKLWDLSRSLCLSGETISNCEGGAIRSFEVHKDKVQAVQWNEKEPTVLLTGSYDRTARAFDSRSPSTGVAAVLGSDVEALRWDPWDDYAFYVSLENGIVLNFDIRTLSSNLESPSGARFTLSAHNGAASSLDVNPHIKGCIVTGGADRLVKIWNIDEASGTRNVSLVTSRNLGVGKVFSVTFSPDDPLTVAAAGSEAKLQIWDVGLTPGVRKMFDPKMKDSGKCFPMKDFNKGGIIGVESDSNESDSEVADN